MAAHSTTPAQGGRRWCESWRRGQRSCSLSREGLLFCWLSSRDMPDLPLLRSSLDELCFFSFCWLGEFGFWLLPWFGLRSLLVGITSSVVATDGGRGRLYAGTCYSQGAKT